MEEVNTSIKVEADNEDSIGMLPNQPTDSVNAIIQILKDMTALKIVLQLAFITSGNSGKEVVKQEHKNDFNVIAENAMPAEAPLAFIPTADSENEVLNQGHEVIIGDNEVSNDVALDEEREQSCVLIQLALPPSDYSGIQVEQQEHDVNLIGVGENDVSDRPVMAADSQILRREHSCVFCGEQFGNRKDELANQIQGHIGENRCNSEICDKEFVERRQQKLTHKEPRKITKGNEEVTTCANLNKQPPASKREKFDKKKSFECPTSKKKFDRKSKFVEHINGHMGTKNHSCQICSKKCFRKSDLQKHMRTHTGERPYKCNVCSKSFSYSSHCRRHEKLHTGIKSFKCEQCERTFFQRSQLVSHMTTHTGEKPYKCNICHETFGWLSTLRTHEITHTGVKPFKCELCPGAFTQRGSLVEHMRTHTGEKPYKCGECQAEFATNAKLKLHGINVHSAIAPHRCTFCGKGFAKKSGLFRHLLGHVHEKPYSCTECNSSFSTKTSRNSHIMARHQRVQCPV